jgi:hypothetical protein
LEVSRAAKLKAYSVHMLGSHILWEIPWLGFAEGGADSKLLGAILGEVLGAIVGSVLGAGDGCIIHILNGSCDGFKKLGLMEGLGDSVGSKHGAVLGAENGDIDGDRRHGTESSNLANSVLTKGLETW